MKIVRERWHRWLPLVLVIYLPISFIITYSIAVSNDHVEPGLPYISDTGTKSPESCVFGQLLNIGAVISGVIVYIRYRYIELEDEKSKLNVAGFIIGILTNLGVSIVGNFQGHTEHVIATASEWMVAFVTVAFFATFYSEFKYFEMKPSEVKYFESQTVCNCCKKVH